VDFSSDRLFSDLSRDVAIVTNFRGKVDKIGLFTFICRSRIPKWIGICNADERINNRNENLVNFGPVTPEFTRIVEVHPSSIMF